MNPTSLLKRLSNGDTANAVSEVKSALIGPGHSSLARGFLPVIANECVPIKGRTEPALKEDDEALQLALLCSEAIHADTDRETKIEFDSRCIQSVYCILARFRKGHNNVRFMKVLDAYVPLFEKMVPLNVEADYHYLNKIFSLVCSVLSASDSIYQDDSQNEIAPMDFWSKVLQISALVSSNESMTSVFNVMKSMSIKHEKCSQSGNIKKVEDFNLELLNKFITFSQLKCSVLIAKNDVVDKLFAAISSCLWQFLLSDLKLCSKKNWDFILTSFSNFVESYLTLNERHIMYYSLITRSYRAFLFNFDQPTSEEIFLKELNFLYSTITSKCHQENGMSPAFMWFVYSGGMCVNSLEIMPSQMVTCRSIFTLRTLSAIFKFSKAVSELLLSSDIFGCCDVNGCQHNGDIYHAFKTTRAVLDACSNPKNYVEEDWSDLLPLIEDCFVYLESMCNKATVEKCLKSQSIKYSLYNICYHVANACYNLKIWKYSQLFILRKLKYMFAMNDMSSFFQKDLSIFYRLSTCYENQGLYKEARVAVLLTVVFNLKLNGTFPNSSTCNQWCRLQKEDPKGEKTSVEVAVNETRTLKSICPDFNIDAEYLPSLLLWELSCYASERMRNSEIVLKAWRALKETNPHPLLLMEGSALACQSLFFCSDKVDWYDLICHSVSSWMSQIQDDEKPVALCAMAVNYYAKFLIQAQSHFDENETKVDVPLYAQNTATVRQPKDVISSDDVCEVLCHFSNLNISREERLMDLLDSSVNYLSSSLQAGLSVKDHAKHPVVALSGEYLLHIAYLYNLWGYSAGAAKAFQLCREFAKILGLDDLLLEALSGLMSTVEVSQDCILEAEQLVETLRGHPKSFKLFKIYYVGRAFQALRTNAHAEGVTALKHVLDFMPTPSTVWCYAYSKFLEASYASLPKLSKDESQLCAKESVLRGLTLSMQHVQEKRLSISPSVFACHVNQALSLALWIGRYYLRRQMPREARLYLKSELKLALQLGITTRAAEFICELAFADLLTENVEETALKISDLKSILEQADTVTPNNAALDDAVDEEDDFLTTRPGFLLPKQEDRNFGASPSLPTGEFCSPMISHGFHCQCYTCKNCSVKNLWILYGHLQAKVNTLRFNAKKSMEIYSQCFKAVSQVLQQLSQNIHAPGRLLQQHQVACTEICLRLDFVDMLVMYGMDHKASQKNEAIFKLLTELQTSENQLLTEALEQKLCITKIVEREERKFTKQILYKNQRSASPKTFCEKTPDSNVDFMTPRPPEKNKRLPLTPLKSTNHRSRQLSVPLSDQHFFTPKASLGIVAIIEAADEKASSLHIKKDVQKAPCKTREAPREKIETNNVSCSSNSSLPNPALEEKVEHNARSVTTKLSVSSRVLQAKLSSTSKPPPSQEPKKVSSNGQGGSQKVTVKAKVKKTEKTESLDPKIRAPATLTSGSSRRATRSTQVKNN